MAISFLRAGLSDRARISALLSGNGTFTGDMHLPDMVYAGFARSPYAHANIKTLRIPENLRPDEFVLSDLGKYNKSSVTVDEKKTIPLIPMALNKVRYVGEPYVAVVATSPERMDDLLEKIDADFQPLPVISDYKSAIADNSEVLYREWDSNVAQVKTVERGDVNTEFASNKSVSFDVKICRSTGIPIEPRAIVASYDEKDKTMTVWVSSQSAHSFKKLICEVLDIDSNHLIVKVPDVGGSFGTKGNEFYSEYILVCLLSKILCKPVKWVSTRTEDLLATRQARDQVHHIEATFDSQGIIHTLRDEFHVDIGCGGMYSLLAAQRTVGVMTGMYKVPNLFIEAKAFVSNKPALGPIRGNGRPEGALVVERVMDVIASELNLDPALVRKRNLLSKSDFPYATGTGTVIDSGDYEDLLNALLSKCDYDGLRKWQQKERANGRIIGIGIGCCVEDTANGMETAIVRVDASGRVHVLTGASPHGQGLEAVLSQICSEELGVPVDDVYVSHGDTQLIPEGVGTFGSRSAGLAGSATSIAARKLKASLLEIADRLNLLQNLSMDRIIFKESHICEIDGKSVRKISSLSDLVRLAGGEGGSVEAQSKYETNGPTFSFAAHLSVLEVDIETGKTRILKYFALDDVGRILNTVNVEGQVQGGLVHALGNAFLEEIVYDDSGSNLTSSLMNYLIPCAQDVPNYISILHHETPSTVTVNGARGAGEGATIAGLPCLVNAFHDALQEQKEYTTLVPITPERSYNIISKMLK